MYQNTTDLLFEEEKLNACYWQGKKFKTLHGVDICSWSIMYNQTLLTETENVQNYTN